MSKQVVIIGGGISGLSVLHQLKQKFKDRPDIQVLLIEKSPQPGGAIQSQISHGCLFETGPESFLTNKPSTLQLIKDLELENDLVPAQPQAKRRYLNINEKLHVLPMNPVQFFGFKPLGFTQKLRLFGEMFVPGKSRDEETVYEFGCRRFGKGITEYFLDAFVTGIYGGDIRRLNLKATFPLLYDLEQKHGSVIRGMFSKCKEKKTQETPPTKKSGLGQLCSLRYGMGQLVDMISRKYRECIHAGEEVLTLTKAAEGYIVETNKAKYFADHVFLCAPAYGAAPVLKTISQTLAANLERIDYAAITVVGLVYDRSAFSNIPEGFGYLVPSGEDKKILGVIFSSNIFVNRSDAKYFLFRIMIKNADQPDEAVELAQDEITAMFKVTQAPAHTFVANWPKGIPQYTTEYQAMLASIEAELAQLKNINIVANYLGGVGVNDCTQNAQNMVTNLVI